MGILKHQIIENDDERESIYYRGRICSKTVFECDASLSEKLDPHFEILDFRDDWQRNYPIYEQFPFDWGISGEIHRVYQLAFALIIQEFYGEDLPTAGDCTYHEGLYHNACDSVTRDDYQFAKENYLTIADEYLLKIPDDIGFQISSNDLREYLPEFYGPVQMIRSRPETRQPDILRLALVTRKSVG